MSDSQELDAAVQQLKHAVQQLKADVAQYLAEHLLDALMIAMDTLSLAGLIALWANNGAHDPGSMASIAIVTACAGFYAGLKFAGR